MHEGCIRAGSSGTNTKDARSELEMHCHAASFILHFQVRGKRRAMGRGRGGWKALDADDTKPGKSEQAWDYDGMGRTSEMPVRSPYIRRIEDAGGKEKLFGPKSAKCMLKKSYYPRAGNCNEKECNACVNAKSAMHQKRAFAITSLCSPLFPGMRCSHRRKRPRIPASSVLPIDT